MKIYTKAGDNGRSSTITRTSLSKDSPIFALLGDLDELGSTLGLAKSKCQKGVTDIIEQLQSDIIALSGEVAGGKKFATKAQTEKLESCIDSIESATKSFKGFVLSGKTEGGALIDVARTVARRAERSAVTSQQRGGITKELLAWLNRLSDLLYVLARLVDSTVKTGEKQNTVSGVVEGLCDKATELCTEIRRYAKEKGVSVVVAVCDAGGNLIAFERAEDAYIASTDIAINKAFTSASLKMSTKEVGKLAQPGASLYGIQFTNGGKIVIFGGGEPLYKNGVIIGALGVSGGSAEEDTAFAEYGAYYFEKEM